MGATRKPRTPAPVMGSEVIKKSSVVDVGAGQEPIAEPPAATPDRVQDAMGDNTSSDSPAPLTGAQDVPDSEGNEPGDDGSPKYNAEHFFKSNWYSHKREELKNLLKEDKTYSYAQIERMLSRQ